VLEPFLSAPLVIERGGLDKAPRIFAAEEGRVNVGAGARAYVTGMGPSKETLWQVYRPGIALIDPDTKDILVSRPSTSGPRAYCAAAIRRPCGCCRRSRRSVKATGWSSRRNRRSSALRPRTRQADPRSDHVDLRRARRCTHRPVVDKPLWTGIESDAGKKSIYEGYGETGGLAIVSLNKGAKDGLEVGHVLAIFRSTTITNDRSVGPVPDGRAQARTNRAPRGALRSAHGLSHVRQPLLCAHAWRRAAGRAGDVVKTP